VQTLSVLKRLAERYCGSRALIGISLLNEPHPIVPKSVLVDFYKVAYRVIRDVCGDKIWIVYSDGYIPLRWKKDLPIDTYQNVYIDTHHYQVHLPIDKVLSASMQLKRARRVLPRKMDKLQKYHPTIVGEWSLAFGSKRIGKKSEKEQAAIAKVYAKEQLQAYSSAAAWYFWSYKTETQRYWSFRYCVENDLLTI